MTETTCINCRWCDTSLYGEPTEHDWELVDCIYPPERLPTSMAGFANREREPVHYLHKGCPTWEAK
jgi:hypothetical protein